MARWDPGTEERLRQAALKLFQEHGYETVTISQIAEAAGITRRSYFRYFPDKREVLFANSDRLPAFVRSAITGATAGTAPLAATLSALAEAGAGLTGHVEHAAERRAVISSSPELRERERSKLADLSTAIRDALLARDTPPAAARALSQLATLAFADAFDQWIDAAGATDFPGCLTAAMGTLRAAANG